MLECDSLSCLVLCLTTEAAAAGSKGSGDGFVDKLITQIIKNIQVSL